MGFRADAVKREYKNSSKEEFMKWFSENFNDDTNSVHFATYTDDVPSVGFVRSNKVNGYFQQFDTKMHRTTFGQCVFADGKLTFVWVFSTKDGSVPDEMTSSSLYEVCEWEKIEKDDERLWSTLYPNEDTDHWLYL